MFKEESSCRLCLSVVNDENVVVIEETIKEVLDVLLLKLNEKEKNKSVMCNECSLKLFAAFNFKATCTDTEDRIFPYVDSEMGTPVDLREIYLKERGKEHLKYILEDERICRLCMQVLTCGFTSVNEVDVDTLCQYIPEVNLTSTTDPVICKVCIDSLDTHTSFLKGCFNVEEKIKNISDNRAMESPFRITTEEIELKSEDYKTSPSANEVVDRASDCRSECERTANNSMGKRKRNQRKYLTQYQLKHKNIPERQMYKCDSCEFKTILKHCLTQHQRVHRSLPGKREFKCDQLKHKDIPEEQMFKCHSCDYKTRRKSNLAKHQLRHRVFNEEQLYKCDSCDYKSITKYRLAQHQFRHKGIPQEQILKCDSCDYMTNQKKLLTAHQLRHKVITEEQFFKCDSCDYKTVKKCHLTRHLLRHKDIPQEQMLKCDSCNYKTIYGSTLARHQLKHKDIPEDQMFKCYSCNYKTVYKQGLAKHQFVHKDLSAEKWYKCDTCDYKTKNKNYLRQHRLKHEAFRKGQIYKCDSCDYQTVLKNTLARHQRRRGHLHGADV